MPWNKRFTVNPGEGVEQAVKREIEHIPVNCPIVDGKLIQGIALPTTATLVIHGLGRVPKGCIPVGGNSYPTPQMIRYSTPTSDPTAEYLYLYTTDTGADQFVDIWVF